VLLCSRSFESSSSFAWCQNKNKKRQSKIEKEREDRVARRKRKIEREKSDLGEDRGLVSRREIREEERWLQWE
jgi:hypothetical protein